MTDWLLARFDRVSSIKAGMPDLVPVPAEREGEVRRTGLSRAQALKWIEEFLGEHPRHPQAQELRRHLSKAPLWDAASRELAARAWKAAREALDAILDVDPADAAARFNLATVLRKLGDLEGSLGAYEACREVFADEGLFYANRSRTLEALGRTPEAIEDLETALRLMPGDRYVLESLARLGVMVRVQRRPDDPGRIEYLRRDEFREAVRRRWQEAGGDPAFLLRMARLLLREGFCDMALEACDRAEASGAPPGEVSVLRARALLALGRPAEAESRIRSSGCDSAEARIVLARSRMEQGDPEDGRRLLESAMERDPNSLEAASLLTAGDPSRAEDLCRRYPDAWAPRAAFGQALARADRLSEALEAFEGALSLGAGDEVLAAYLSLLARAGRVGDMVARIDGIPDLERRHPEVRWIAAAALRTAGRGKEARSLLESIARDRTADPSWRHRAFSELMGSTG